MLLEPRPGPLLTSPDGWVARFDQPRLMGHDDGLCAITQPEFAEYVRDVGLNRGLTEEQRCGDLAVKEAARHQRQHRELTIGQRFKRVRFGTAALTIGFALIITWPRRGRVKTWRASNVGDAIHRQSTGEPGTPAPAPSSPAARFEKGQEL